jgi:hypothetical protein
MEVQQILDELGIEENDYLELVQDYIEQLEENLDVFRYAFELEILLKLQKLHIF